MGSPKRLKNREKAALDASQKDHERKVREVKEKLKTKDSTDMSDVKQPLAQLEEEANKLREKKKEMEKKEKLEPWNVDTISKDGFSKTMINTAPAWNDGENMTEDEKEKKMREFAKKKKKKKKKGGVFKKKKKKKKK